MEGEKTGKRAAIMKAAMELIAERGFHHAPTSMIAEKAGVAIGSIYRYFENKDALIIELEKEIERLAMKEITLGYDRGRPLRERYFHVAKKMIEYMISHPLEFRFIEQFYHSPYGNEFRRDRHFARSATGSGAMYVLDELYEDGRSEQIIKDFELPLLFSLAFATLFNIARDNIAGFNKLDEVVIDRIVGACWDAIRL
jgi:TetR/AcrR family transcriptional regulator, repressor of fatR-cypB operon